MVPLWGLRMLGFDPRSSSIRQSPTTANKVSSRSRSIILLDHAVGSLVEAELRDINKMEGSANDGKNVISENQVDEIGLGIAMDNKKLGKYSPNHHNTSVAASQEIHLSNQIESEDGSPLHQDKVNRLAIAFQNGRQVRFVPNGESGSCDVFAADLKMNLDDPGNEKEGKGDRLLQSSQEIIYPGLREPIVNPGYSGARNHARSTAFIADRDENDDNSKDIESEDDVANEKENSRQWEHEIAAADRRFETGNGGSNQDCTVIRRELPPTKGHQGLIPGEIVAVHGRAGIEWHHVSPLPLNFNKHGLKTPSVHSNGTEQDCASPLFPKSCRTVLMQAYQEFSPNVEITSSEVAVESFDNQLAENLPPPEIKVSKWLSQQSSHGRDEFSHTSYQRDHSKVLNIFEDDESERPTQRSPRKTMLSGDALKDVTNLRSYGYLRHNSFFIGENAAREKNQNVFAGQKSLDEAKETPIYQVPQPDASTVQEPSSLSSFASARQASEGVVIGDSPSPSDSEVSKDENEILPDVGSSRAADQAFALARLEGRVSPKPSSPIHIFVKRAPRFDVGIEVEDEVPSLPQPKPKRGFHLMSIVGYLDALVRGCLGHDTAVPNECNVIADGSLIERPTNPTPRRAQR